MFLSHDMPAVVDLVPPEDRHLIYSKYAPWTEISLSLIPTLLARGVTQAQIDQIMIDNPRRFFESRDRGAY